jgi:hypothetical protein
VTCVVLGQCITSSGQFWVVLLVIILLMVIVYSLYR